MTDELDEIAATWPLAVDRLRGVFRGGREAVFARVREGAASAPPGAGREAVRALTGTADALLARLFAPCAGEPVPPGLALVALGGYGRAELAPFSDLDLLLLHDDAAASRAATETAAGRLFPLLWDLGVAVGHSSRGLEALEAALAGDIATATALVEGRFLAGDRAVFARFEAARDRMLETLGDAFLRAKAAETAARYGRHGESIALIEPNVKESRGALRDVELLALFARAGISPVDAAEAPALEAAADRLLLFRFLLHLEEGKKQDRLVMDLQPALAARLGYADTRELLAVEAFMGDYYRAAKTVDRAVRLAHHALERRVAEGAGPGGAGLGATPRWRPLGRGLVAVGGEIELEDPGSLEAAPDLAPAFEVFAAAQREKLEVSEATVDAVRRLLPRVTQETREDPRLGRVFQDLLGGWNHVAATLRMMHRAGLLGEYVPEFGTLDCLVQYDAYHDFTVDEHSLNVVEALERFGESREREDLLRVEVLGRVSRLPILRLGCLLHDMGKGKGGNHIEVGTSMVPEVARRLGLPLEDARTLRFLVEHHLALWRLAERSDPSSEGAVAALVDLVKDEERLDLLYLLSVADARGVSPRALPRWRDAIVTRLYELGRDRLRDVPRPPLGPQGLREALAGRLPEGVTEADLDRHLAKAPRRYPLEVEPFEVAVHLRLVGDLERGRDLSTARIVEGPIQHLWVCARDRHGLFAAIAGALAARGASILAADAYTRHDGIALDRFTLALPPERAADDAWWAGVEELLREALAGGADLSEIVAAARARVPYHAPRREPSRPPLVKASNKLSDRYTVIDVGADDRIGLLHDLSTRLAALGLDIHYAKVSTRGTRAADVFYVTEGGRKLEEAKLRQVQAALGDI